MSNKNKISILFEALGIDTIIKSLKDLVSNFSQFEKGANKASSASDNFGDDLSKMAKESGKAESAIKGMGLSLINSVTALTSSDKSILENNKSLSQFKTEMENANKARNELIKAAVSESQNINDVISVNEMYKDTLEKIQNEYGGVIENSKEYQDLQKELSNSITAAADANKELNDMLSKGKVSFEGVNKTLAAQQNTMKQTAGVSKSLTAAFGILNAAASGIMPIISAVMKAKDILGTIIDKGKEYSDALNIQVEAENKMAIAISKNSKLTDGSTKSFTDFAGQMQKTTAYGDEFVMSLIKQGAQANLSEGEIKRLTKTSLDFAAASGGDAAAAMKDLTAGMNDVSKFFKIAEESIGGFTQEEKKMLLDLQNSGKQAEAAAIALSKIEDAVGGSAQKEVETFAGKQKQLGIAIQNVKEEFGRAAQALAKPFLDKQTEMVQKFFDLLKNPKVVEPIQKVITGFKVASDVIQNLAAIWIERFKAVISILTIVPRTFFNIAQGLFAFATDTKNGMNSFVNIIAGAVGYVQNFGEIATKVFQTITQTIGDFMQVIEAAASFNFDNMKESFKTFKENAVSNFKDIGNSIGDLFDPSKMAGKGKEFFEKIKTEHTETVKNWEQIEIEGRKAAESAESDKQGDIKGTLEMKLQSLQEAHAFESEYALLTIAEEKKRNDEIKNLDKKLLEDKVNAMKTELSEQIKKGKKIDDIYVEVEKRNKETGEIEKKERRKIVDEIKDMNDEIEKKNKEDAEKTEKTWKEAAGEITNSIGSIMGSILDMGKLFWNAQQEDLTKYDEAIEESYRKQEELLLAFDEKQKALNEENEAVNTEKLEEELARSIEANDLMSENAIRKKLDEIAADKKKKEEEKKLAKEREKIEKDTNREIAMAEYNKSLAEHRNQVAMAETEKNKAIADAGLTLAQGIAMSAVGVATSVAQLGPIAGLALGLATAASIMGSLGGAVGNIKGAANNLESVKASAPKPPAFAYGTMGYSLKEGEEAVVGERGAEIVRRKGSDIEVVSNSQMKERDRNADGLYIENVNIYPKENISVETLTDILNSLKLRHFSFANV